jgi:hypothetical protein
MPDATDPTTPESPATDPMSLPVLIPAPPAGESADERIRRLEEMVARLTRAVEPPHGYSPAPLVALSAPPADGESPRRWYRFIFRELKLIARMYLDPRYRLSRVAQFGVPLVFILMVTNYLVFYSFCFGGIPILSPVAERLGNLILAVVGYSILRKEAVRYQAVLDYLARTGRG